MDLRSKAAKTQGLAQLRQSNTHRERTEIESDRPILEQISEEYMQAEKLYLQGLDKALAGDYPGAVEDFEQSIWLNPNNSEAYYCRGLARYKLGQNEAAVKDFSEVLWINPIHTLAYISRGFAHRKLGDIQTAIDDCERALQIEPKFAKAYVNRGLCRSDLGDKQGAIEDLQTAAQLFAEQGDSMAYQEARKLLEVFN